MKVKEYSKTDIVYAIIFSYVTSFLFNLSLSFWIDDQSLLIDIIKLCILLICLFIYLIFRRKSIDLIKYLLILITFVVTMALSNFIGRTSFYISIFDTNSFFSVIGGSIALKILNALIIIIVLLCLYGSKEKTFLKLGNLKSKADKITWLGITENKIEWGRLAWISGIFIAIGTVLLTYFTVINSCTSINFRLLFNLLPLVIAMAIINSFMEGIIFRNSIIASLSFFSPKAVIILISAIVYGSYHFYGAPGGFIGVIMSSVLGWFMSRSVLETKGFLCAWIIHLLQDFVIFSILILFGNFVS